VADALIRQATPDDVAELAELRREFTCEDHATSEPRADYESAFERVVGEGLGDGSWVVWVAESEGRIVAHTFVAVVDKVPRHELELLIVWPSERSTPLYSHHGFASLGEPLVWTNPEIE